MLKLPRNIASITPSERPDNRRAGRMRVDEVRCSLGRVLDLSKSGCLIKRSKAPKPEDVGRVDTIWIDTPCGGRLHLRARLARHRHVGFRRHACGYEFIDVTDEQRAALVEIARSSVRHELGLGKRAG
ncbi:MAG: hypothetical protein Tsb0013_08730 [Phycisphaerales bacterium]